MDRAPFLNTLVPARYGRMLVNPNDVYVGGSFVGCGEFSEHEVAAFRELVEPGDVVFDVGANIGAHTVPLAQMVGPAGRVFAFEPQLYQYHLLVANIALNDLWNVDAQRLALGDQNGAISVPRLDPARRQNFGGLALGGEGDLVSVARLDTFRIPRLDFLKLDVEGMELPVLTGAEDTITRLRPILYVEADRELQRLPLAWWIREHGYVITEHVPPLWNDANVAGASECPWPEGKGCVSINWLCMPDGREPPALAHVREPVL